MNSLVAMASALREAHGRAYDELIDVSALDRAPAAATGAFASCCTPSGSGTQPSIAAFGAVMVGDELLHFPRIHDVLRRRRVSLVETSAVVPHLTLSHDSGVLLLDLPMLRQTGFAAAKVAQVPAVFYKLALSPVLCAVLRM